MAALRAPRLTTTTHNPSGVSTILSASTPIHPFYPFGPAGSSFSLLHTTETVPASNSETAPEEQTTTSAIPRPSRGGVTFCTTDIAPGGGAPLHRTLSLDYCVVLEGEIQLGMEDGTQVNVRKGEMVVQRGTLHSWKNKGDVVCRILCVMVGADEVKVEEDGRLLGVALPVRQPPPSTTSNK